MNNVFLEVINSVNLVNKKMNDNMKSLFSKYVKLLAVILLSTVGVTQAWGETITMSSIFTGKNQSATITSPLNATVSTTANAGNAANSKLGSDNNYFQIVLTDKTFSAASINGCINSSDKTKNWGFQFTTNGGTTWESEVTQANDGQKSAHDINVGVTIPSGANGIRIIRKAGTSTYVYSVTLTTSGGSCSAPTSPSISGTAAYTVGDNISLTASATGTSGTTTYTWYKGADWATASASSPVQATSTSGATFSKASCVVGDAGTYWCNISNGTGCDVQVSKKITVSAPACADATPTISASPNKTVICSAGSPTSLTLTASDYEPGATLQWYKDGVSLTGQTSATLTVSAAGSYVVKATKACEVASSAYVVTQQTPTITGGTSVALGGTLTLTGSNTGASWTSSNTSVATVSDGTVSGVSVGAATITYTTTDGCTATKEVSVVDCEAPSVALSSASTSCGLSAAVDLSAFVSSHNGTLSYAVTSGSGTVNASTGAFTAPSSAGATVVRVTATGDGATVCSGTATADITITAANLGYIPGTYHTVACGDIEVIDYSTLASADATTSGKWLVNPRGISTKSRTYTNVSNDANGNPNGITDNIPKIIPTIAFVSVIFSFSLYSSI